MQCRRRWRRGNSPSFFLQRIGSTSTSKGWWGIAPPPTCPMTRFNHGELVYLMKKWSEFSIYEDGMPGGNYLHSSARYARLKITTRAEPIEGERGNRYLMGTPQFIMITRKGEGQ